ncbi:hypothetical protein OY671_010511, partial [Metschnikowia pulcherrima]
RLKPFVKPDGIDMPDAELPAGDHIIRVDVKDSEGRSASTSFTLKPTAAEASVCSSCSRDITIPDTSIAERDDLIRKRASASEESMQAKAELEALRSRHRISSRRS